MSRNQVACINNFKEFISYTTPKFAVEYTDCFSAEG